MANGSDRLVWIDCEMTGLDLETDQLVEVAVVVTDFDLKLQDAGFDIVIKPDQAALDGHERFRASDAHGIRIARRDPERGEPRRGRNRGARVHPQVRADGQHAPLAGNTIGTDRAFLAKYMPKVDGHLHYRSVDVSSIKELSRRWYPRVYFHAPQKDGGHRALADILESIRELVYYRKAAFVADPGPTTDEVQVISAAVAEEFASRL